MNDKQKELLTKLGEALDEATKGVVKDITGTTTNLEVFVILEIIKLGVDTVLEIDDNQ